MFNIHSCINATEICLKVCKQNNNKSIHMCKLFDNNIKNLLIELYNKKFLKMKFHVTNFLPYMYKNVDYVILKKVYFIITHTK